MKQEELAELRRSSKVFKFDYAGRRYKGIVVKYSIQYPNMMHTEIRLMGSGKSLYIDKENISEFILFKLDRALDYT